MTQEFKASTFFNKYLPAYMVTLSIDDIETSYYSYEFMNKTIGVYCGTKMEEFFESRMLVYLYSVISIFENKLIYPSGKFFNISDISKNKRSILKHLPAALELNFDILFLNGVNTSLYEMKSFNLSKDIKSSFFYETDFYSDDLMKKEIIKLSSFLVSCYKKDNKFTSDYIKKFDINDGSRFYDLLRAYNIITVDDANEEVFDDEAFIQSCIYSNNILNTPERFELFKIIESNKRLLNIMDSSFSNTEEMSVSIVKSKSKEQIKKEQDIEIFKAHYELYANSKMRVPTLLKLEKNYDLKNSIQLFNNYPYSERQYENQAYTPLMMKAPVKHIDENLIEQIENMVKDFPHFYEVINYITISLRIRNESDKIINFKHLLLVGDHGIGKNAFTRRLNEILGYVGNTINMSSVMASFELSGMDVGWSSSAPGFFFNTILKNNVANPVVILDDIDKVTLNRSHGNVNIPVIELLEPSNSKMFYENFFQTNLDMSNISVIALANSIDDVDRGVLDLLKVFIIEKPQVSAISSIVFSIYKELKKEKMFASVNLDTVELNELVVKFIMNKILSPRSMMKVIEQAINDELVEKTLEKSTNVNSNDKESKNNKSIDNILKN